MIRINENYNQLKASYLFLEIANKVAQFQSENTDADIIRLGIGDVTKTLPPACISAFHNGVEELSSESTFKGYGPYNGYAFLREKIAQEDFQKRGADIDADEIFISDGSKCDTGNFQELFANDITIAIPDPVYPVYLDTNIMAGRAGDSKNGRYKNIVYLDGTMENGFIPQLPSKPVDLIYLCFPNNPTGAVITKSQLKEWVGFAKEQKALILFDAAYEAFIRDETLPHSIFEIEGAKEVAVEFRSFSKTAGFTGTRCAYTIVPKECVAYNESGSKQLLHPLWQRRQSTKFNGVSYPVQKAAEAVYSSEGKVQIKQRIDDYLLNARIICKTMDDLKLNYVGGKNSPYIWIHGNGRDSWDFFDMLLKKAQIVCTPGKGFGQCGEGYIRISAFNSRENVQSAMERMKKIL
ncbi:MAG: LL-diaminopimelate aminotransferase [Deltaproteobacteria bacterium]|nr:MAG: LL-diaminopimelate aminotransferase [Deltaproteobacteria bacterium]RLC21054.1 MAG: LL-diaminopimelate aminotransferase [Deltaproteobacteria bacterium]